MAIRKKLLALTSLLSVSLVTSCTLSDYLRVEAPKNLQEINATYETIDEPSVTISDVAYSADYEYLPSTGDQKVLVLLVDFDSKPCTEGANVREDLDEAFNKGAGDIDISVTQYYKNSSYGKLNLDFVIAPSAYRAPNTLLYYLSRPNASKSIDILEDCYKQYVTETSDSTVYNSMIGIYYLDYRDLTESEQDLFWAFTYNLPKNEYSQDFPIHNIIWASYYFLFDSKFIVADKTTKVLIHEAAHLFGIDDYYDYDDISNPCTYREMMSGNSGDHNAYTKFLLGWITPIVPTSNGKYVLESFEESGQAVIIGNEFNGTAYDEYLIISYYTPTLNNSYYLNSSSAGMYTKNGIMIYHVDSRLFNSITDKLLVDISDFNKEDYVYETYCSNTYRYSNSNERSEKLIEIIPQMKNEYSRAKTLFESKTAFGIKRYRNFTFNNDTKPEYDVYFDTFTNTSANLYFSINN